MSLQVVKNYKLPSGCELGLKVAHADGRPHSGKAPADFRWSVALAKGKAVTVTAPDWSATSGCGGGLHAWRWADGDPDASPLSGRDDATVVWMAVEYRKADAIDLRGKVKVPTCRVVAIGSRGDVATWIAGHAPKDARPMWATATAGTRGTATAGYAGTATAGDDGTATAGDDGTATAGDAGTATAGTRGTATAGTRGTATAGDDGTATAGTRGTATAGDDGVISILWWDGRAQKYRRQVGVIDGVTLKPWVRYTLNVDGAWVEGATLTDAEKPDAVLAAAYARSRS